MPKIQIGLKSLVEAANRTKDERSLDAGFIEHLVKPIKMEKLESAIRHVVGSETALK